MIEVRRLGARIGAEITGVDVLTLNDADFGIIYRTWLDYNVVVVRDQALTLPEYVRYSGGHPAYREHCDAVAAAGYRQLAQC